MAFLKPKATPAPTIPRAKATTTIRIVVVKENLRMVVAKLLL